MEKVFTAEEIAALIYRTVFRFSDEKGLQDRLEDLFKKSEIPYAREVILSPQDRIDFLAGKTGIEVKVDSSPTTVQRQLWRYAESPQIETLILVTSRSTHKEISRELLTKKIIVVHLLSSIF